MRFNGGGGGGWEDGDKPHPLWIIRDDLTWRDNVALSVLLSSISSSSVTCALGGSSALLLDLHGDVTFYVDTADV